MYVFVVTHLAVLVVLRHKRRLLVSNIEALLTTGRGGKTFTFCTSRQSPRAFKDGVVDGVPRRIQRQKELFPTSPEVVH
jgi:hypothetical protein